MQLQSTLKIQDYCPQYQDVFISVDFLVEICTKFEDEHFYSPSFGLILSLVKSIPGDIGVGKVSTSSQLE
jgi:hypothetical protein